MFSVGINSFSKKVYPPNLLWRVTAEELDSYFIHPWGEPENQTIIRKNNKHFKLWSS